MKKNSFKLDTRTMVFLGLLISMHIVLTRLVVIDIGAYRISVGSVCTILAGLWFGPIGGGICGFVSDILGCLLKGYAINPFITVAAILWGVIPALVRNMYTNSKKKKTAALCGSIVLASIASSLIFTTMGLVLMLGYNFYAIMPGRIVQWAIMTPMYCVLTTILYYSPLTRLVNVMMVSHKPAPNA